MNKDEALRLLEETLDLPPHTLAGHEKLRDLALWDSLSTMAFIAMVDKRLGLPLPGSQVARCRTVAELIGLLGPTVARRAA